LASDSTSGEILASDGHKIDVVVALSMACLAAVKADGKVRYDLAAWFDDDDEPDLHRSEQLRLNAYILAGGMR
jgi:hypothetical protein